MPELNRPKGSSYGGQSYKMDTKKGSMPSKTASMPNAKFVGPVKPAGSAGATGKDQKSL